MDETEDLSKNQGRRIKSGASLVIERDKWNEWNSKRWLAANRGGPLSPPFVHHLCQQNNRYIYSYKDMSCTSRRTSPCRLWHGYFVNDDQTFDLGYLVGMKRRLLRVQSRR